MVVKDRGDHTEEIYSEKKERRQRGGTSENVYASDKVFLNTVVDTVLEFHGDACADEAPAHVNFTDRRCFFAGQGFGAGQMRASKIDRASQMGAVLFLLLLLFESLLGSRERLN